MNEKAGHASDRGAAHARFDRTAIRALAALGLLLALLAAAVACSATTVWPWSQRLVEARRPAIVGGALIVLVALFLLDLARQKNVAWRRIRGQYGHWPEGAATGGSHGAGRGRIGGQSYWGLRCFGSAQGLLVARVMSAVNRPLFLPWSAMKAIEAYPNALTGKAGFETDMEARIELRDRALVDVEVPWLAEFRQLMPQSIRFRLTRRPEKVQASRRPR